MFTGLQPVARCPPDPRLEGRRFVRFANQERCSHENCSSNPTSVLLIQVLDTDGPKSVEMGMATQRARALARRSSFTAWSEGGGLCQQPNRIPWLLTGACFRRSIAYSEALSGNAFVLLGKS